MNMRIAVLCGILAAVACGGSESKSTPKHDATTDTDTTPPTDPNNQHTSGNGSTGAQPTSARRQLSLALLCQNGAVRVSGTRGLSLVFKAEDTQGQDLAEITDAALKLNDGGDATGSESASMTLTRPQGVVMQSLILLDGSESLSAPGLADTIKAAAARYIEAYFTAPTPAPDAPATDPAATPTPNRTPRQLAIFKFYGDRNIVPVADFSSDPDALRTALMADTLVRAGTSTALHDAVEQAITKLGAAPVPQLDVEIAAVAKTLVVFTDGRDEVYAGAEYQRSRTHAIETARTFRATPDNAIFVAGVASANNALDEGFLTAIASASAFVKVSDFDALLAVFEHFSQDAAITARRYYQLNVCSNRRRGPVTVKMRVTLPDYAPAQMAFDYDASSFADGPCDATTLETCPWSPANAATGTADPRATTTCDDASEDPATCTGVGTGTAALSCETAQTACASDPSGRHCWPSRNDCATISQCGGRWDICPTGAAQHCTNAGQFMCCPAAAPVFCDGNLQGYSGGCWSAGTVCSTLKMCETGWEACHDANQTPLCTHNGFCG